jgi:hypothetical protein
MIFHATSKGINVMTMRGYITKRGTMRSCKGLGDDK